MSARGPWEFLPGRRAWYEAALLVALAAVSSGVLLAATPRRATTLPAAASAGPAGSESITVSEAQALPGALWVDARSSQEYAAGHVPGAVSCPEASDDLAPVLAAWSTGQLVVVYCSSDACDASRDLAAQLRPELAGASVRFLLGGWDAWRGRGR